MHETISASIGESLHNYQAALDQDGSSLKEFIEHFYIDKWLGDDLYHIMAIRTTFVNSMQTFLAGRGLCNMERISMSPITDPLAHDIEHTPSIHYKGHTYLTTHSMIYAKFLACFNPKLKGIFVDSPNIRLELESPSGAQRAKYLIDFSQMDLEVKRERGIQLDEYLNEPERVTRILKEDYEIAISFFEDMIIYATSEIAHKNDENLKGLGVAIKVPKTPFPRFRRDVAIDQIGSKNIEQPLGKGVESQFFWVTGLMRENYDLIYPYLKPDGSRVPIKDFSSDMIYNYDLCAQSLQRDGHTYGPAYEVLSGGVREWLYESIVARLIDNHILAAEPIMENGNIQNIQELAGYGPFLMAACQKDEDGKPLFPDTYGGGIGIERTLFALALGDRIKRVDEVTLFGKNPDLSPIYLF